MLLSNTLQLSHVKYVQTVNNRVAASSKIRSVHQKIKHDTLVTVESLRSLAEIVCSCPANLRVVAGRSDSRTLNVFRL